jgi:hypothetical protein
VHEQLLTVFLRDEAKAPLVVKPLDRPKMPHPDLGLRRRILAPGSAARAPAAPTCRTRVAPGTPAAAGPLGITSALSVATTARPRTVLRPGLDLAGSRNGNLARHLLNNSVGLIAALGEPHIGPTALLAERRGLAGQPLGRAMALLPYGEYELVAASCAANQLVSIAH